MVNGDSIYSISWREKKYTPRKIVIKRVEIFLEKLFVKIEWWDHVTVNPDEIKIIVFKRGISKGLNEITLGGGGQVCPISMDGEKDEWK